MEGELILDKSQGNPFDGATADQIKIVEPSNTAAPEYGGNNGEGFENMEDDAQANTETESSQEPNTPQPQSEAKPQEKQSATATPETELDIKSLVSKFGEKDLLQALGYDEFAINALGYYKEVGSLDDYVSVKSIDFTQMTPEQIMRYDYARKYKGLPEDALEFKVRKDLRDKYGITEDLDEDQLKAPMALFGYEMDSVRKELIADQAKFAPPPRQNEPEANTETLRQEILADKSVQAIIQSKAISIGNADDALSFGIDPEKLLPILYDSEAYNAAISIKDKNGNPTSQKNTRLLMKVAALLADEDAFDAAIINHGKSLGKKVVKDKLNHPSTSSEVGVPPRQEKDVFEALARRGVHRG